MELYVHIPFCVRKCRYCSFVSFIGSEHYYQEYIELVLKEAELRLTEVNEPVKTVYIGGGTPSLLPVPVFKKLLKGLYQIFSLNNVTEYTCEANPGTLTEKWLECAAENGINRLSVGMQAFQEEHLQMLGRIHHHSDVVRSLTIANQAGINNINLDLIFGIPNQTLTQWLETIDKAISLHPCHISAYGLIPEDGTPLYKDINEGVLSLPDPEKERIMYDEAIRRLSHYGMEQYEISNFSFPGKECIHNIGYWTQIPYIGLGISAASMVGVKISDDGISYIRKCNPESYQDYKYMIENKKLPDNIEKINCSEARFETMMLGLRMNKGINDDCFKKMHGKTVTECFGKKMNKFINDGLIIHDKGYWRMTRRGFDIQNMILVELMED